MVTDRQVRRLFAMQNKYEHQYQGRVHWKPPMVTKMEVVDGTILLHVDNDVGSVDSQAIAGFAIAGNDKKFQPARAESLIVGKDGRGRPRYNRKVIVLSSPHVSSPVHFRYAWGRNPMGNLQGGTHKSERYPLRHAAQ